MKKYEYKIGDKFYTLTEEEHSAVFNHLAANKHGLIILRNGSLSFAPRLIRKWDVSDEQDVPENLALDTNYPDLTKKEAYQKRRKELYDRLGWNKKKTSEDDLVKKNEVWRLGLELSKYEAIKD